MTGLSELTVCLSPFRPFPCTPTDPSTLACTSPDLPTPPPTEAYSCKSVSRERKLFKSLEEAHSLEQQDLDAHMAFSPENRDATLDSCFGRLDQKDSRCVLYTFHISLSPRRDVTEMGGS